MLGNIPFLPYSTNSMKVPLDEILNLQRVDDSNTHEHWHKNWHVQTLKDFCRYTHAPD